ncbi:MAG: ATP-binding protein [Lachnospiraceae bacterium]|nr:ATP-binding protein [Lachnospiraceae bacterium]
MKKSMIKKFSIVIVLAVILSGITNVFIFDKKLTSEKKNEMLRLVKVMADEFNKDEDNNEQAERFGDESDGVRVTIVRPDGVVTGDSQADYRKMDNHSGREEIKKAQSSKSAITVRKSSTVGKKLMYAVTRTEDGYYIRLSEEYNSIILDAMSFLPAMLLVMLISCELAIYLAGKMSEKIASPILVMNESLSGVQDGTTRLDAESYPYDELKDMAVKINKLAEDVSNHIETIKQEKDKIEYILDRMKEGFMLLDSNSKIIIINKRACKYMSSDKSVVGKDLYHLTRNLQFISYATESFETGKNMRMDIEYEDKIIEVSFNPVERGNGDIENGLILIMTDVSAKRNAEKLRREFFANASHELKTPITSIKGSAELLCSDIPINEEQRMEMLKRIGVESERMTTLIEDILMINRLESGELSRESEFVDMEKIVKEDIDEMASMAEKAGVHINAATEEAVIFANPRDIHELTGNLIVNAIKYNEEGGSVDIVLKKQNDMIEFSVRNDGEVIPLNKQGRVFERFYRVDKGRSRNVGGTGLGLAIVKHVVDSLNGVITLESTEKTGTKFTVKLPCNNN